MYSLSFWDWATSLEISSFLENFTFFYCSIKPHCVHKLHFHYMFTFWWTARLIHFLAVVNTVAENASVCVFLRKNRSLWGRRLGVVSLSSRADLVDFPRHFHPDSTVASPVYTRTSGEEFLLPHILPSTCHLLSPGQSLWLVWDRIPKSFSWIFLQWSTMLNTLTNIY